MVIYTDGSCNGNGKAVNSGGFGVVVLDNNENIIYTYSERCENTTNNREELKAIIYAMEHYGKQSLLDWNEIIVVYSDSNYCVQTLNEWMFNWERNGWIKSDKKIPENLDLIKKYFNLYQKGYRIDLRKIKGHADNKWNNLADLLATGMINYEEVIKNYEK